MDHLSVRRAEPGDADTLAAFNVAMALETEGRRLDPQTVARGVRAVLDDPRRGFYLVAARGGRVVGQLMITFEWSDWLDADFWWVQSVYVAPEARRQGVFKALWEHVANQARANPRVCGLRLYVERTNSAARAAYESLGLSPSRYEMYEKPVGG